MRAHTPGRYAALALLLGGLACAGNKAGTDDGTVVAQDTAQAQDTSAYKGMERDTTAMPAPAPTAADTTQYQPQATPAPSPTSADTSSYVPSITPTDSGTSAAPAAPTAPAPAADSTAGWSKDTSSGTAQ